MHTPELFSTAGFPAVNFFNCEHPSSKNILLGNAQQTVFSFMQKSKGKSVFFCYEKGFFAVGRAVKQDCLAATRNDVFFCLDELNVLEETLPTLINSASEFSSVVVVGDQNLACAVSKELNGKNIPLLFVPLEFEFINFCSKYLNNDNYILFDQNIFNGLTKNKKADGLRNVLQSRLFFVEMRVNELIGTLFNKEESENLLNQALKECGKYFKDDDINHLIFANLFCAFSTSNLPFSSPCYAFENVLACYAVESSSSERLYHSYKIILDIYDVFLNSEQTTFIKIPSRAIIEQELYRLLHKNCFLTLPEYYYDQEKLNGYIEKIKSDKFLKQTVNKLKSACVFDQKGIYYVYGGRKYSVEMYNQKQRTQALQLASASAEGDSLLKIIWATGCFEYLR